MQSSDDDIKRLKGEKGSAKSES